MNIDEITDHEELFALADSMGLRADRRLSFDKLKAMIKAEYKAEHAKPTQKDIDSNRKVSLTIHKTDGDTGSTHVPVSVNGKTWLIKRGETVEVPAFVVEVLRNAVKEIYVQDSVQKEIIRREVPSYPFSASA